MRLRQPFVYVWQHRDVFGRIQRSHVVFFQTTLEIYPIGQCMCVSYIIMYTGDMCALVSSSTVRTNMHIRHIRAFFFRKRFR